ncbi:hypothetical protein BH23THE1_BH23THE1_07760 [soil metagenome]
MNFIKYAAGMFVFAGIISLIAGSGGNYFTQSVNAQSIGEQFGDGMEGVGDILGGGIDETSEAVGNLTESTSGAANETGEAAGNATEGASQSVNETASGVGQAADNATTSENSTNATQSDNPLDMLMNLFQGGN